MDAPAKSRVKIVRDIVYVNRAERPLCADVYVPEGERVIRPAIIWLHGGGWRFGSRRQTPDLARYFTVRGYVMVSIDYRLSKEALFPAAVEDVKTAIRWLKAAASDYGVDRNRIGLWGSSAGGHLGALAAATGAGLFEDDYYPGHSSSVAAVADIYGPSDFLQMDAHRDPTGKPSDDVESIQLPKGSKTADASSMESMFLGAPIESRPDRVRAANPVTYVKAGLPPFLLLHGLADTAVPPHQSELLYDALVSVGNDVTLGLIHGLGHGFLNRPTLDDTNWDMEFRGRSAAFGRVPRRIFELIGDWFDRHL